jgi:ribosomal protein S18 acetylase RimI-like enzyme
VVTSSLPDATVLDDPVGESLRGRHAHLARRQGRVLSYEPAVASFSALPPQPAPDDWSDLATLVGPDGLADLFSTSAVPPEQWSPVFELSGFQMVADDLDPPGPDAEIVVLGEADVPAMLELTARTRPGPFWAETHRLGTYVGIRDHGALVAMAGERLRPPGWTEISAVCTSPEARGRGLGRRLVLDLAARITARDDQPFLHVVAENSALRLYERLGFRIRREVTFRGFRTPPA